MSYIEWELEEFPERYKRLHCNRVIDEKTLARVTGCLHGCEYSV